MTSDPATAALLDRIDPRELPRLALFLGAYLDAEPATRHGNAARAAYDYATEAELDELEELAFDWRQLAAAARRIPLADLNRLLRERFATSWQAASLDEIDAVTHELERAIRD